MGTQQQDLYPDVTSSGGLAQAMRKVAELRGCDARLPPWATDSVVVETTRGLLSVHPSTERRLFRLRVEIIGFAVDAPGFSWNIGATDDLERLVESVAAWGNGTPLDELKERFEFLDLDVFTRSFENKTPTSLQWSGLMSSEFHQKQWNLLCRLHADEVLRDMFPSITHGAVRLRVDPLDATSRQVQVCELDEERYQMLRVGVPEADWIDVPADGLIARLRAALHDK
ncbi:hypothetical protein AB0451_36805 [Streptomyces sp. NPDC052000]|uniref:hypothetical protein n=1 Tax=Streptomyces sp. NPDC052000 TaxID=3155676 RepID=UPI00344E4321